MNNVFTSLTLAASAFALISCSDASSPEQDTAATANEAIETTDSFTTMGAIPAPDAAELAEFTKATRALYDLKEQAFAEGKVDPIVKRFYAENVVSVGPEGKPEQGRAELTAVYEKIVPTSTVRVEPIHSYVSGDAGWEWANFHVTPRDPAAEPFSFVILFLWTKADGKWVSAGDAYVVGSFSEGKTGPDVSAPE